MFCDIIATWMSESYRLHNDTKTKKLDRQKKMK